MVLVKSARPKTSYPSNVLSFGCTPLLDGSFLIFSLDQTKLSRWHHSPPRSSIQFLGRLPLLLYQRSVVRRRWSGRVLDQVGASVFHRCGPPCPNGPSYLFTLCCTLHVIAEEVYSQQGRNVPNGSNAYA